MPISGLEKAKRNFLTNTAVKWQLEYWPSKVRELDEQSNGQRFRSERLSYSELWTLYSKGIAESLEVSEEEEARRKEDPDTKKAMKKGNLKEEVIVPMKAWQLPGRYHQIAIDDDNRPYHTKPGWGYLRFPEWLYARDQARKDLYWLCKEVFGLDLEPHVHKVVCNQFVQKDFDGVFKEDYEYDEVKKAFRRQNRVPRVWVQSEEGFDKKDPVRMLLEDFGKYIPDPANVEDKKNFAKVMILLDPRGFFKSTIDAIDCIQWMLNTPDVRILIVTGVLELADEFLKGMIKPRLYLARGEEPTAFHYLFPEYVLRGVDGTSGEDITYDFRKYTSASPTLGIISVKSSLSGRHCDVLKFDDIVTDQNSLTEETRLAVKHKADGARNLLMVWGWWDIIGTRYFPDDYYGETLDQYEKSFNPETEEHEFNLKFFTRAAWVVKKDYKHVEERSLFELTEQMVDLTFPEHVTFKDLRSILRQNEKLFRCQQLNQPVWGSETPTFTHELLMASIGSTIVARYQTEEIIGAIDLAREDKRFSDYTALAIGKIYSEGSSIDPIDVLTGREIPVDNRKWKLLILDVQFGKWSDSEKAYRIAVMNDKWRPKRWFGEDTGGLELFREKVRNLSTEIYGHWPVIFWNPPDNSLNAKINRIKSMEILLRDKRMLFKQDSWNGPVFEQLEKYTGQKSSRTVKDDVPDVLSMIVQRMPRVAPLSPKEREALAIQQEKEYRERILRMQRERIFGENSGGFGSGWPQYPTYGEEPQPPQPNDPASRFRRGILGNGPWR